MKGWEQFPGHVANESPQHWWSPDRILGTIPPRRKNRTNDEPHNKPTAATALPLMLQVMEGSMSITLNTHGELCSMQKAGGTPLEVAQIVRCSKIAAVKASELTQVRLGEGEKGGG